jgi:hypothetical protein
MTCAAAKPKKTRRTDDMLQERSAMQSEPAIGTCSWKERAQVRDKEENQISWY